MQKQLLTNGNAFKRTDGRWGGVVWYKDEKGERKRKSFSGTTKAEVNKKMTDYITKFEEEIIDAIEGNKTVKDSLLNYLQVFKYPNVERVTYDRNEQIYKNQLPPLPIILYAVGKRSTGTFSLLATTCPHTSPFPLSVKYLFIK